MLNNCNLIIFYELSEYVFFSNKRSAIIEEQANIQLVEPNQVRVIEKQTLIEDTPDSLFNAILEKDKELKRILHEKEMLLSRLLNIPENQINDSPGNVRTIQKSIVFNHHFCFVK